MRGIEDVDKKQVEKAVAALLKYIGKEKKDSSNLLEEDELLYLVIALKKIPQGKRNDKPIRLLLPNPIYSTDGTDVCLFVKDHKGEGHKAAKEKVRNDATAGVAKVIGVSKLKTKYESFESKRQLCNSYDLFVADDRILPSLPKLLGKTFFKKKKQPVPVKLTGKDWAAQIRKACEATYLHLSGGSSLNIRVARSSQEEDECVENVMAVLEQAAEKLPGLSHLTVSGRKHHGNRKIELWHQTLAPGSGTPIHNHDREEIFVVLGGNGGAMHIQAKNGSVITERLGVNSTITILPNARHQFVNEGTEDLSFIAVFDNPPLPLVVFDSWEGKRGTFIPILPWDAVCPRAVSAPAVELGTQKMSQGGAHIDL